MSTLQISCSPRSRAFTALRLGECTTAARLGSLRLPAGSSSATKTAPELLPKGCDLKIACRKPLQDEKGAKKGGFQQGFMVLTATGRLLRPLNHDFSTRASARGLLAQLEPEEFEALALDIDLEDTTTSRCRARRIAGQRVGQVLQQGPPAMLPLPPDRHHVEARGFQANT